MGHNLVPDNFDGDYCDGFVLVGNLVNGMNNETETPLCMNQNEIDKLKQEELLARFKERIDRIVKADKKRRKKNDMQIKVIQRKKIIPTWMRNL